jgi:tetratricopeptide (TPR) repeat protein
VTAIAAVSLTAFFLWAVLTPSYLLQEAEDLRAAHRPSTASFARAVQYPWPNAEAREQYGYALIRDGRYRMAAAQLEQALDGVDTGRIYLALAGLAYRRGDRAEMQRWIDECYWRWPSSAALWELVYDAAPSASRETIRGRALEWGISLDGRGRAYSATAGSSTP